MKDEEQKKKLIDLTNKIYNSAYADCLRITIKNLEDHPHLTAKDLLSALRLTYSTLEDIGDE